MAAGAGRGQRLEQQRRQHRDRRGRVREGCGGRRPRPSSLRRRRSSEARSARRVNRCPHRPGNRLSRRRRRPARARANRVALALPWLVEWFNQVAHFLPALLPSLPSRGVQRHVGLQRKRAPGDGDLLRGRGATPKRRRAALRSVRATARPCTLIFGAQRKKVKPECVAKFDALMQCSASMTYACDANGRLVSAPQGALRCAPPRLRRLQRQPVLHPVGLLGP